MSALIHVAYTPAGTGLAFSNSALMSILYIGATVSLGDIGNGVAADFECGDIGGFGEVLKLGSLWMAGSSNFLGINTGLDATRAGITLPGGIPYVLCYTTDTGRLWFFDGVTTGGIELALAGDLPTESSPLPVSKGGTGATVAGGTAAGNIWALAIANNLSDVGTLATAQANIGIHGPENRIINGDMLIDQRNAGAVYSSIAYTLDRWDNRRAPRRLTAPPTSANSFSSNSLTWVQRIEGSNIADLGFGTSNAKNLFLSVLGE